MLTVVAGLLAITNIMLAMSVLVLMLRPEKAFGWLSSLVRQEDAWRMGQLSEDDVDRLRYLAIRLHRPLLLLLFSWSFFCGALLSWVRLV